MNRNDTRYGPATADAERPRPAQDRDEWILDEAIKETFPASDTPSPVRPGSLVGSNDARRRHKAHVARQMVYLVVLGAIATIALVGSARRRGPPFSAAAAASSRWLRRRPSAEASPHE
jgi:hypothetical protein